MFFINLKQFYYKFLYLLINSDIYFVILILIYTYKDLFKSQTHSENVKNLIDLFN